MLKFLHQRVTVLHLIELPSDRKKNLTFYPYSA
jgi:hypothetical protein